MTKKYWTNPFVKTQTHENAKKISDKMGVKIWKVYELAMEYMMKTMQIEELMKNENERK